MQQRETVPRYLNGEQDFQRFDLKQCIEDRRYADIAKFLRTPAHGIRKLSEYLISENKDISLTFDGTSKGFNHYVGATIMVKKSLLVAFNQRYPDFSIADWRPREDADEDTVFSYPIWFFPIETTSADHLWVAFRFMLDFFHFNKVNAKITVSLDGCAANILFLTQMNSFKDGFIENIKLICRRYSLVFPLLFEGKDVPDIMTEPLKANVYPHACISHAFLNSGIFYSQSDLSSLTSTQLIERLDKQIDLRTLFASLSGLSDAKQSLMHVVVSLLSWTVDLIGKLKINELDHFVSRNVEVKEDEDSIKDYVLNETDFLTLFKDVSYADITSNDHFNEAFLTTMIRLHSIQSILLFLFDKRLFYRLLRDIFSFISIHSEFTGADLFDLMKPSGEISKDFNPRAADMNSPLTQEILARFQSFEELLITRFRSLKPSKALDTMTDVLKKGFASKIVFGGSTEVKSSQTQNIVHFKYLANCGRFIEEMSLSGEQYAFLNLISQFFHSLLTFHYNVIKDSTDRNTAFTQLSELFDKNYEPLFVDGNRQGFVFETRNRNRIVKSSISCSVTDSVIKTAMGWFSDLLKLFRFSVVDCLLRYDTKWKDIPRHVAFRALDKAQEFFDSTNLIRILPALPDIFPTSKDLIASGYPVDRFFGNCTHCLTEDVLFKLHYSHIPFLAFKVGRATIFLTNYDINDDVMITSDPQETVFSFINGNFLLNTTRFEASVLEVDDYAKEYLRKAMIDSMLSVFKKQGLMCNFDRVIASRKRLRDNGVSKVLSKTLNSVSICHDMHILQLNGSFLLDDTEYTVFNVAVDNTRSEVVSTVFIDEGDVAVDVCRLNVIGASKEFMFKVGSGCEITLPFLGSHLLPSPIEFKLIFTRKNRVHGTLANLDIRFVAVDKVLHTLLKPYSVSKPYLGQISYSIEYNTVLVPSIAANIMKFLGKNTNLHMAFHLTDLISSRMSSGKICSFEHFTRKWNEIMTLKQAKDNFDASGDGLFKKKTEQWNKLVRKGERVNITSVSFENLIQLHKPLAETFASDTDVYSNVDSSYTDDLLLNRFVAMALDFLQVKHPDASDDAFPSHIHKCWTNLNCGNRSLSDIQQRVAWLLQHDSDFQPDAAAVMACRGLRFDPLRHQEFIDLMNADPIFPIGLRSAEVSRLINRPQTLGIKDFSRMAPQVVIAHSIMQYTCKETSKLTRLRDIAYYFKLTAIGYEFFTIDNVTVPGMLTKTGIVDNVIRTMLDFGGFTFSLKQYIFLCINGIPVKRTIGERSGFKIQRTDS
ncbi:hypothetical protein PCE1_002635 [Barthelona sp. PCE]